MNFVSKYEIDAFYERKRKRLEEIQAEDSALSYELFNLINKRYIFRWWKRKKRRERMIEIANQRRELETLWYVEQDKFAEEFKELQSKLTNYSFRKE